MNPLPGLVPFAPPIHLRPESVTSLVSTRKYHGESFETSNMPPMFCFFSP